MKSIKLRIFITAFLASLPFWFGFNYLVSNLENLWFLKIIGDSPSYYSASVVDSALQNLKPKIEPAPDINTKAAISVLFKDNGEKRVIYEKNADQKLPIASLTKLMSADIILENFDISQNVIISKEAILKRGLLETFSAGQSFKMEDLLFASMVESENDGMSALAEIIGYDSFVDLMNLEAKYLGLKNTVFFNPTGLNPIPPDEGVNLSTAVDISELSAHIFKNFLASYMLSLKEYDLYTSDGAFHHTSNTTNAILAENIKFNKYDVIGGKTGYTKLAGGCLIIALQNKNNNDLLVNVLIGSDDRFDEMQRLTDWAVNQ